MRIGVAGPVELSPLGEHLTDWDGLPEGFMFPYTTQLILGLLDRGHHAHVFALNDHIKQPRRYVGADLTVDVLPMRPVGRHRVRDNYRAERLRLESAMRLSACDVIHAHWTYEFGAAAVRVPIPNVVTAHDSPWTVLAEARHLTITEPGQYKASQMARNAARVLPRALMSEQSVRRADLVTAVSPNVKEHLERWFFPRGQVRLIQNGLIPDATPPRNHVKNSQVPVFGFIANGFGDRKNTPGALEALVHVRKEIPGARLILMGRGHESGGPAEAWARTRGLSEGCEWRGITDHDAVETALREEIDILVHPSFWEACSIAIMEAQRVGIPVVGGSQAGGVNFSLQGGRAGLLVDVAQPKDVAHAMIALVREPAMYHEISSGALNAVRDFFNLSRVLDLYEDCYDEVVRSA